MREDRSGLGWSPEKPRILLGNLKIPLFARDPLHVFFIAIFA
jgi:hypothetical protein